MAESTVKSASTSSGTRGEGAHHPMLALVLLATGGRDGVHRALEAIAPACVESGVELCVVWSADGSSVPADWPGLNVQWVQVDPASSPAEGREQAARALGADILLFTDDRQALAESWNDVLAFRLGLLRRGAAVEDAAEWTRNGAPRNLPGGGAPA